MLEQGAHPIILFSLHTLAIGRIAFDSPVFGVKDASIVNTESQTDMRTQQTPHGLEQ